MDVFIVLCYCLVLWCQWLSFFKNIYVTKNLIWFFSLMIFPIIYQDFHCFNPFDLNDFFSLFRISLSRWCAMLKRLQWLRNVPASIYFLPSVSVRKRCQLFRTKSMMKTLPNVCRAWNTSMLIWRGSTKFILRQNQSFEHMLFSWI